MSTHEEIDKAVAAHGKWKQKLRMAIDSGTSESTPERVSQNNNCAFGKWLHERINPGDKTSDYYTRVVELHSEFHIVAGEILKLALNGQKEEASSRIQLGSQFSKISSDLTRTMLEWKASLA